MPKTNKNVIQLHDHKDPLREIKNEGLQYCLLSPRNPATKYTELHNKVYNFWMQEWKVRLAELNYDESHLNDDFIRQDIISCILAKDQVAAVLLFSFFSLDTVASQEFRYMKNYTPEYFEKIRTAGVRSVMSMQYFAVHPEWRGRKKPTMPIGLFMVGLTNQIIKNYDIDASIGLARQDHKVGDLVYAHGGQCIIPSVSSHNDICDLVVTYKENIQPHPSKDIARIEDYLWQNRVEALNGTMLNTFRAKKSA